MVKELNESFWIQAKCNKSTVVILHIWKKSMRFTWILTSTLERERKSGRILMSSRICFTSLILCCWFFSFFFGLVSFTMPHKVQRWFHRKRRKKWRRRQNEKKNQRIQKNKIKPRKITRESFIFIGIDEWQARAKHILHIIYNTNKYAYWECMYT